HLLGVLDGGLTVTSGETLHFDDVSALTLQRRSHVVQGLLGILAEDALAGLEADFGLGCGFVLIDISNYLLDSGQAGGCLLRGVLRGLGAVTGVNRVLIGLIRLAGSELNALLRTRINVLDHLAVAGGELIELIDAVADGLRLPLHIFLASERVQVTPETLMSIGLQRLLAAGAGLRRSRCGRGLGRRLVLGSGIGLREGGHRECASQEQSQSCAICHFSTSSEVEELRGPSPCTLNARVTFRFLNASPTNEPGKAV